MIFHVVLYIELKSKRRRPLRYSTAAKSSSRLSLLSRFPQPLDFSIFSLNKPSNAARISFNKTPILAFAFKRRPTVPCEWYRLSVGRRFSRRTIKVGTGVTLVQSRMKILCRFERVRGTRAIELGTVSAFAFIDDGWICIGASLPVSSAKYFSFGGG